MSRLNTEGMPTMKPRGELGQQKQDITQPLKVDYDPEEVSFQSDKKFSQAIMFTSACGLFACLVASNYIAMRK